MKLSTMELDLSPFQVVKAGPKLIPLHQIKSIDISNIEDDVVIVETIDKASFEALGADAIDIVMALKPSSIEGLRLKWRKNAWAKHNFAHALMQIMIWLGYKKAAIRLHDRTTPRPR